MSYRNVRWSRRVRTSWIMAGVVILGAMPGGRVSGQDPGLPPPSGQAPAPKAPGEPPIQDKPDARAIVQEMLRRLGDLSSIQSLRHTTAIPQELADATSMPRLLQLSWLRADAIELRATGEKRDAMWGTYWEGLGWSTEDGGKTWVIEKKSDYINALRWFSPMSVLLDLHATPSLISDGGREKVGERDCHRILIERPHLDRDVARFALLIDADAFVLRRIDTTLPVVIEAWETVQGVRVPTRASVSGDGVRLETTYADYTPNVVPESIRVMPDAVHAMWMQDHTLDPRRWQGRAAIRTIQGRLGRLAQAGPVTTTATLPEDWMQVLGVKPEQIAADREVCLGLNPMEFLRTLQEWVVADVELDEKQGEEPIVVLWLEHPEDDLEVALGIKPDGELIGIETEFFYLDVTEWREQDGVRVISKAVWGDQWSDEEMNVVYKQVTFGAPEASKSPPGGSGPSRASTTTTPAANGPAALVDGAFGLMGSAASLDAVSTLSHQFMPPAWFAARTRLTERVNVAARPPHRLLCATNDARLGSITQVYDGEIAWMRWEGRGGWRRNPPDLFLDFEPALSPAAYLLTVRALKPTYTFIETPGDDAVRRIRAESGDFTCTLLIDARSGRFSGIIDGAGRTLRLDEWLTRGEFTWPVAATLDLPRHEGGQAALRYAGYEVNIVPEAMFARPPDVR